MIKDQIRLKEVEEQLEVEKQRLFQLGQNGLAKAQNGFNLLEEFRERPLEATLLAICGLFVATKVMNRTQKP